MFDTSLNSVMHLMLYFSVYDIKCIFVLKVVWA